MVIAALAGSLLHLLLISPLYFFAARPNTVRADYRVVVYFIIVYLASSLLLSAFQGIVIFPGQQFNWIGKIVTLVFLLLVCFFMPSFSIKKFGLTRHVFWRGTGRLLLVCILYFILRAGLYFFSVDQPWSFHPEAILFQATLPGLQEELLFRGVLMGLLARIFADFSWRILNVRFGWSVIITSLLFGLVHGLGFSQDFDILFDAAAFVRTALEGFLFGLIVRKTRSIFPAVIYHNLLNLIGNH